MNHVTSKVHNPTLEIHQLAMAQDLSITDITRTEPVPSGVASEPWMGIIAWPQMDFACPITRGEISMFASVHVLFWFADI